MKRKPAISPGGSLVLPALSGHVALRDVVFHYPARPDVRVLCGLSLEAQPGQVVALVGPSGGGKVGPGLRRVGLRPAPGEPMLPIRAKGC